MKHLLLVILLGTSWFSQAQCPSAAFETSFHALIQACDSDRGGTCCNLDVIQKHLVATKAERECLRLAQTPLELLTAMSVTPNRTDCCNGKPGDGSGATAQTLILNQKIEDAYEASTSEISARIGMVTSVATFMNEEERLVMVIDSNEGTLNSVVTLRKPLDSYSPENILTILYVLGQGEADWMIPKGELKRAAEKLKSIDCWLYKESAKMIESYYLTD